MFEIQPANDDDKKGPRYQAGLYSYELWALNLITCLCLRGIWTGDHQPDPVGSYCNGWGVIHGKFPLAEGLKHSRLVGHGAPLLSLKS